MADSTTDDYGAPRSTTPSVPPGFLPPSFVSVPHDAPTKPTSRFVPTSAPFTPSRSLSNVPRPATPVGSPLAEKSSQTSVLPATATSQAKQDVRKLASSAGLSRTIASQSSQPALQDEDFPALDSGKGKAPATPMSSKVAPKPVASRKPSAMTSTTAQTPSKEKRSGVLNISVPAKITTKITTDVSAKDQSATMSNPPDTPSTTSLQSPLSKTAATKTLRISSAMKPETPTAGSATPSSVASTFQPPHPPSRQPSLASISRHERPGTPTSELISDNASITSTSMSRANSPPPSKIGSAPVRATTKSMQKKQRREAQKEKERAEQEAAAAAVKEEPKVEEVAPIMGRKKKQKKEKAISARGGSTPAVSRPASPGPTDTPPIPEEGKGKNDHVEEIPSPMKQSSIEPVAKATRSQDAKGKGKSKSQASTTANTTPEPAAPEVEEESAPAPTEKHTPTAASTLQSLITSGAIPDPTQLAIFKSPNAHSSTPRPAPTPDTELAPPSQKLHITPEDRAALLSGKPVRKGEGPTRVLLTPNGDYVKNLTEEEEERYLQLQESLAKQSGATTFVGGKQGMGNNGFSLIGGRAVPNGPPSFFPSPTSTLDPVSKIQRDEALSYINQYVLPSLSTNSQLEKALNANANMLDVPAWGTGGSGESSGEFLEIGVNESGNGMSWNGVSLLGFGEAEQALGMARKETEGIEKKLVNLWKKNRRVMLGSGH